MADLSYYSQLDDFEEIKDYIDLEPIEKTLTEDQFPPFQPDYSAAIVVENVPVASADKIERLKVMLLKIYSQVSTILTADDIVLPVDASGSSLGFCFIKFSNKEESEQAQKLTNGLAVDKKHTFQVTLYSDMCKYLNVSDAYAPPRPLPYSPRPDPTSWLTDPQCRDQFTIRHGLNTEIYWANNNGEDPSLVYGGEREKVDGKVWCENYVRWSPQGTYFATFHAPGIRVWGGENFESCGRFMHQKVEETSFSPCESYLATYRFAFDAKLNPQEAIQVWDIRMGEKLRTFPLKNPLDVKSQVQASVTIVKDGADDKNNNGPRKIERVIRGKVKSYEEIGGEGYFAIQEGNTVHEHVPSDKVIPIQEPNRLKWSHDGKYLARLGNDCISIYELPSMGLLDKKSLAANNILDFVWSPKSNMLSYWAPAVGNNPAIISIVSIPDRKEIGSRKLFDVTDGKMEWQNDGDYLCVYMTKMSGKKKSFVLNFFRIREPGIPVEQLELNEPILHMSWEPSGDRCVILTGESRSPNIAFYSMSGNKAAAAAGSSNAKNVKNELTLLFTKTGLQCNQVHWSPAGATIALAYFTHDCCLFELFDVDTNTTLNSRRHDRCTRLYWDPSGRYLVSATITDLRNSAARGNAEDGFNVYTFQGNLVSQVKREKLYQFAWRPRPRDVLSAEEKKKIVKNLKKHEKIFEKEDRQRKQELQQELLATRYQQAKDFLAFLHKNRKISSSLKSRRVAMRNGYDSDDDRNYTYDINVDETVLGTREHILN